jgi:hypothetical protein
LRSDRGLTYAAEPPAGSHIVAGSWWPADYRGAPLVSFDAELAQGMGLKLGDTLSVNLLGREITATIANLRQIDWARLGINFAIVFAPGALEAAPQTPSRGGLYRARSRRGQSGAADHRPLSECVGDPGTGGSGGGGAGHRHNRRGAATGRADHARRRHSRPRGRRRSRAPPAGL